MPAQSEPLWPAYNPILTEAWGLHPGWWDTARRPLRVQEMPPSFRLSSGETVKGIETCSVAAIEDEN